MHDRFRPLPLLGNAHLQTLLGHLLAGRGPRLAAHERQVGLPDGDRVVLHDLLPRAWRPGGRAVMLLHGLCGSHRSGSVQRLAGMLLPGGARAFIMDLRGAGRGAGLARRTYTAGSSDDVRHALAAVRSWCPGSPLALAGFSLGGNIALKLAGEAAADPVPGLDRVAAINPPIDLGRCAELLAEPRNRIYELYFVRKLVAIARRQRGFFPDLPEVRFPRRTTMRLFDDLYTAPRWGYAGALDYYRRASAAPLVGRIAVPAWILTARDDPFVAVEPFEALPRLPHVEVHIADRGGHLGFLGSDGRGGFRWGERRAADWLLGAAGSPNPT